MKKKIRRKRKIHDWPSRIIKGDVNQFYKSTDWDIVREAALIRDKYTCQFYIGKFRDGKHIPSSISPQRANTVHHIIPIRERPDLCLDIDNLVSLSFDAHEIIEDRNRFRFPKKKTTTKEKW